MSSGMAEGGCDRGSSVVESETSVRECKIRTVTITVFVIRLMV